MCLKSESEVEEIEVSEWLDRSLDIPHMIENTH